MAIHREPGVYERFKRVALGAVQSRRTLILTRAAQRFRGYRAVRQFVHAYNTEDQMVICGAKIYCSLLQKHGTPRCGFSLRKGTRSYKTFLRLAELCAKHHWLIGEFLMAQFSMLGKSRLPLLNHIAGPGAVGRYRQFIALFRGRKVGDAVSPSERVTMDRATKSSIDNLVVLMFSRGKALLLDDDFAFMDRYSLAYFSNRGCLPKSQLYPDVQAELQLMGDPSRAEDLRQACTGAAQYAVRKLEHLVVSEVSSPLNQLREAVSASLRTLYGA